MLSYSKFGLTNRRWTGFVHYKRIVASSFIHLFIHGNGLVCHMGRIASLLSMFQLSNEWLNEPHY